MVQGKLWLWPDSSPEGVAASERVSPAVVDDLDTGEFGGNWYARDLPYGFDTLIENLVGERRGGAFCAGTGRFRLAVYVCVAKG